MAPPLYHHKSRLVFCFMRLSEDYHSKSWSLEVTWLLMLQLLYHYFRLNSRADVAFRSVLIESSPFKKFSLKSKPNCTCFSLTRSWLFNHPIYKAAWACPFLLSTLLSFLPKIRDLLVKKKWQGDKQLAVCSVLSKCQHTDQVETIGQWLAEQPTGAKSRKPFISWTFAGNHKHITHFPTCKVALEQNRKMTIQLKLDLEAELGQVSSVVLAYIHFISSSAFSDHYSSLFRFHICKFI